MNFFLGPTPLGVQSRCCKAEVSGILTVSIPTPLSLSYILAQDNWQHDPQAEHYEPECWCRGSEWATETRFLRRQAVIDEHPFVMMAFEPVVSELRTQSSPGK
jgi:hypothetical protein